MKYNTEEIRMLLIYMVFFFLNSHQEKKRDRSLWIQKLVFGSRQVPCFLSQCAAVLKLKENRKYSVLLYCPAGFPPSSSLATPSLSTKQTDWQLHRFPENGMAVQTFLQPLGKLQTLLHFDLQLLRSGCLLSWYYTGSLAAEDSTVLLCYCKIKCLSTSLLCLPNRSCKAWCNYFNSNLSEFILESSSVDCQFSCSRGFLNASLSDAGCHKVSFLFWKEKTHFLLEILDT